MTIETPLVVESRAFDFSHRTVPGPLSEELLARQSQRESNARSYPRRLPIAIDSAAGHTVKDVDGRTYVDFLMGAGVLPLGHNQAELLETMAVQAPILTHGLDFPTRVKDDFHSAQVSMLPSAMRERMKIHFCGPTGANTVEAAIKLAKANTGRGGILSFRGGFHGSTHMAMAVTGLLDQKESIQNLPGDVHFAPYSYCARCPLKLNRNTCGGACASWVETAFEDPNGGMAKPAAIILELVQGEGGVIPAEQEFVSRIVTAARAAGVLVIVDEVQTGCGRTGTWLAFEQYNIEPDIICMSKALSGVGTPMGIIIYDEALDTWGPGAHIGTFRGNQLGFASGAKLIEIFARDRVLENVRARGQQIQKQLGYLESLDTVLQVRGRGLMWGIEFTDALGRPDGVLARRIQRSALEHGLILEVGGRDDSVLRLLPPLNVTEDIVFEACQLIVTLIHQASSGTSPSHVMEEA